MTPGTGEPPDAARTDPVPVAELITARLDRADSAAAAHVFVELHADAALARAHQLDASPHMATLPLFGVPVSVKDNFDVAGQRSRAGSAVLETAPPAAVDAPAVTRLRAAGAVILGRTNMVEFAYGAHGINERHGTPANPTGGRTPLLPGGSSSGAAVSVALGLAGAALGTDTAGSCRIPAALCGVVGFKPRRGRIPGEGIVPLAPSLDVVGLLGPTVDICARVFGALAHGSGRPPPAGPARPRLGLLRTVVLGELDDEVAAAFGRALDALTDAGAHVREFDLPLVPEACRLSAELIPREAIAYHRPHLACAAELYDPWVRTRLEAAAALDQSELGAVKHALDQVRREAQRTLTTVDALVFPTVPVVAPPRGPARDHGARSSVNSLLLRNTALANVLDVAEISIPCGAPSGPAVGLSFLAPGPEERLLGLARLAAQFVTRQPPGGPT